MTYYNLFSHLKEVYNYDAPLIEVDDMVEIRNFDFHSPNFKILSGEAAYNCPIHNELFPCDHATSSLLNFGNTLLDVADSKVAENSQFRYSIFTPKGTLKTNKVIMMFHGFNEKHWHKYLTWAYRLCNLTGKTVILFPIAFHMNRAPQDWSDKRKMYSISENRKSHFPDIIDSSLSNVAISTRLQIRPQRFVWSGLQTYHDVIDFITTIRQGGHPLISETATFDIFAYSIGSLLSQILMMANSNQIFDKSRLFIFCGGATFNRYSAVTKFILDSVSNVELYSFLIEHLERHMEQDKRLGHFLGEQHIEGKCFKSMLNYKQLKNFRESRFNDISDRISAIGLEQDTVIPPYEMCNTLKGSSLKIPINVESLDFEYAYKHEDPFPVNQKLDEVVMKNYISVFDKVAEFLQ
ncbi:MAG: hypothetical protein HXX14_05435 [Bacteroidetes bacterium]|nr:hypothetical protein [Bacteroidota bacterium]